MGSKWSRAGTAGAALLTAAVGVTVFSASTGAQTDPATPIVNVGLDSQPAMSDDGNLIVFRSEDAVGLAQILIHDRTDGTTIPLLADTIGDVTSPSISGDGCVASFIVPGAEQERIGEPPADDPVGDPAVPAEAAALQAPTPPEIRIVERCVDPANPTELPPIVVDGAETLSGLAMSINGGVFAVSTGQHVLRYVRNPAGVYQPGPAFDGPSGPTPQVLTSPDVAISDDGSVVVFASGSDLANPATLSVNVWADGVVTNVHAPAWAPSVSGDGRIVVFEDASGVLIADRDAPQAAAPLVAGGSRPRISGDGNHVVHESGGGIRLISWTGSGAAPFDVSGSLQLTGLVAPTASGAVISRHGTAVASDVVPPQGSSETDIGVVSIVAEGAFSSDAFNLGVGDIGDVLTTDVSFTNEGPASMFVDDLAVESPFVLGETSCSGALRPLSTCTIGVSITIERFEDAFGFVTLTGNGTEYVTVLEALGQDPAPATTSPPATTPITTPPTQPGTTGGGTTGGTTRGGTTRGSTTRGTTRGTTTGGSSASATTTVPGAGVNFTPPNFDFAPTIVNAGTRQAQMEIVNSSSASVSIVNVRLNPEATPFEVVATTCAGESLAASARCTIDISFTPTEVGPQAATLLAQLAGGVELQAAISGVGAPPPSLDVIPPVATTGQVVTVRGAGFPTGLTVTLRWGEGSVQHQVVVDDTGGFAQPIVVLPHTPQGPVAATVDGQVGQFGEVETTMLVTATSDRSTPAVLDGVGPSVGR